MDLNNNGEIIYPEEASSIISRLMDKYGLTESNDDFIEKFSKGETTAGEIIAGIIELVAEEKIQIKNLAAEFSKALNIPEGVSKNLAKDIEKEIIVFIKKGPTAESTPDQRGDQVEPTEKPARKIETKTETVSQKSESPDVYREPIE